MVDEQHWPTDEAALQRPVAAHSTADNERVNRTLVEAYRPLHNVFMLTVAGYYTYVTAAHFIDETGATLAILAVLSAVTAAIALAVGRRVARREVSLVGVERLTVFVHLLMLANVLASQLLHFAAEKLVYFPLLVIAFAMSSITTRATMGTTIATLASMLLVVALNPEASLVGYGFVAVTSGVCAIGLTSFIRGVVRREMQARFRSETAEAEARKLANVDFLTGLPNRRAFMAQLQQVIAAETPFAVGVLDLDGFKGINDAFGHGAGDRALVEAGRRLSDCPAFGGSIARIGGDEFALIVEGEWDAEDLAERARMLLRELRRPLRLNSAVVNLGGSLGLAISLPGETSDSILDRADYAAHEAKHHHKGDVVVFAAAQDERLTLERKIERELLRPDFTRHIEPAFQMVVDSRSGDTIGFEALARWQNPSLGRVSPGEFIPVAERLNLVPLITRAMVRHALDFAAELPPGLRVSVNLSPQDLASPDAMRQIAKILESSALRPCPIDFEITETAVMRDIGEATEALLLVMAHGCRISLDDFGTGHSSLTRVQLLPLDRIKIDRSFVTDIATSKTNRAIVKTTLDLCQNLSVSCVVEGVETAEQVSALEQLGARYFQGFHFSRPLPPREALTSLKTQRRVA